MFRDYFTNRWVLGGFCFLIVFGIACYVWYQHELAPYKQQVVETEEMRHQRQETEQATAVQKQKTISETDQTPSDSGEQGGTPTSLRNTTETSKAETANTEKLPAADAEKQVKVSPYGFGPYPEVPQGFIDAIGNPFWTLPEELLKRRAAPPTKGVELMQRVLVKMWKLGHTNVEAATLKDGKVYVQKKNCAYVRYKTFTDIDGREVRYISSWESSGSTPQPPRSRNPRGVSLIREQDIPPGIELIDLDKEDPGINPYEFLELN